MSNGHCTNEKCLIGTTGLCFNNKPNLNKCKDWIAEATVAIKTPVGKGKAVAGQTRQKRGELPGSQAVEWSGFSLRLQELELVSRRSNPLIIATVGEVAAGKSSFLGMLHSLLLRGYGLTNYTFAGSVTLLGWEALAVALRFHKGQATDQAPTPSDPSYYSLQHWALRRADGRVTDVIFPDASGEVFTQWAVNQADSNAENVRWIHRHADAFVFFVDCEALVNKRGEAVTHLVDLANRLTQDLNGRQVVVAWSKADLLGKVRAPVKQRLEEQLEQAFGAVPHFQISKELRVQPDPQQLENLLVLDAALERIEAYRPPLPELRNTDSTQDLFLLYRGR